MTGTFGGLLWLWDAATGELRKRLGNRHQNSIRAVAFSPDGKRILTGGTDKTRPALGCVATDLAHGPPLRHEGPVVAVAFALGGKTILTASSDGTARLWDAHAWPTSARWSSSTAASPRSPSAPLGTRSLRPARTAPPVNGTPRPASRLARPCIRTMPLCQWRLAPTARPSSPATALCRTGRAELRRSPDAGDVPADRSVAPASSLGDRRRVQPRRQDRDDRARSRTKLTGSGT